MKTVLGALALLLALMNGTASAAEPLPYRWVYIASNLQVDANVGKVEGLLRRAKAAGYNGALLADYKLNILDRVPDRYFVNIKKVKATADALGIGLFPAVAPVGYSNGLLAHDPNLAEGFPVRDAPFVVRGATADIAPNPAVALPGGDFENNKGDQFVGWDYQDGPGSVSFADRTTFHGGAQSLRFENLGGTNGRVTRRIAAGPFRQLHLSVWIKTRDFETPANVRMTVLPEDGKGDALCHNSWSVRRTQDWTEYHAVFNSLRNDAVRIYIGCWGGKGGTLWLDDAKLESVGFLNVVRRPGCPLTVKSADGATTYEEGRDFEPVRDPRMGTVPFEGSYEVYHKPPALTLTPNSRIKDGQRLRVSFFHCATIYDDQVSCCLSEPKVYDLLRDQIQRVETLLKPPGFFLSHDEFREGNWCDACLARTMTPGQMLADNVRRCSEMVRAADPKADQFVWSDMFDPAHNARDNYYLVNGTLAGSWDGLPKRMIVVNWNSDKPEQSLSFFAKRGHRQILAGYYDGAPTSIRAWLDKAKGIDGVVGVMYTTWADRYDDLEAFARSAWGTP